MEKLKIGTLSGAKVIDTSPSTPVSETLDLMRRHQISCIVVQEEGQPIGIITERNIVTFAARQDDAFVDCPVRELMSSPVVTATEEMDIFEAYNLLSNRGLRHLVLVTAAGRLTGVITQSDIVRHLTYDAFVEIKKVAQVMSKIVFTVQPDFPLKQALVAMANKALSCMVVIDRGRPKGILTERDVARLLIDLRDISLVKVGEVMSTDVLTISGETPVPAAIELMKEHKVRRLVVVDRQGTIIGLTTQSDIVKGLEGKYIEALHEIIREKESEIKDTSRDLAEKTVYLDNILDSSIDYGIIAVALDHRVTYFNPGAELILGVEANRVINRDIQEIHRQQGMEPFLVDEIFHGIRNGKRQTFIIQRQVRGDIQYISARASGIFDRNAGLVGFFLMISDITQQTRAEQQLQQAHDVLDLRVQERTQQLAKAVNGAINAMALIVEMRDPYTSGHQRRVADLAQAIASRMGLDKEAAEGVFMAGLIHDIGKIRVPSDILCNPGRLTEAEFSILKPHPEIGANILQGIELPWPVAEIILRHHEKLDGSGYPHGVHGDQISILARILTVADVMEAMSSHRPYRPALGHDVAVGEIIRNRGRYYDPDVVDACLDLFDHCNYRFPPHFQCVDRDLGQ